MKKLLISGIAAIALIGTPAFAADMAVKAPPPAPAPVPYSWTGFYVGGNAGYGWATADHDWTMTLLNNVVLPATVVGSDSHRFGGALGGLQAGYNWQVSNFLLGVETDIQISGQQGDQTFLGTIVFASGLPNTTSTTSYTDKLPWFGTLRARAGLLATDRWLLYATGGLAYGRVEIDGVSSIPGSSSATRASVPPAGFNASTTKAGWTVGGGVEGAITNNWTWKVEYLYMDLGSISGSYTFPVNGSSCTSTPAGCFIVITGSGGTFSSRVTDNIVRLGVNYRFY
jgi:outer membrane immunogenic protein